jgi:uncharacterized protein (TIGR00730 family)
MKSVGVFCAASEEIDPLYNAAATEVGRMLGRIGAGLVYGGARFGLMEATAKGAKESGADITGVVPMILEERGRVSSLIDEKINCCNLSDRKDIRLQRSDVMVALPGGIGTLDEIFHVMAAATIGYHAKPVILYNVNGYWNGLDVVLSEMRKAGFVRGNFERYMVVADSIAELEKLITEE